MATLRSVIKRRIFIYLRSSLVDKWSVLLVVLLLRLNEEVELTAALTRAFVVNRWISASGKSCRRSFLARGNSCWKAEEWWLPALPWSSSRSASFNWMKRTAAAGLLVSVPPPLFGSSDVVVMFPAPLLAAPFQNFPPGLQRITQTFVNVLLLLQHYNTKLSQLEALQGNKLDIRTIFTLLS